jgi:hypothetical protein
MYESEMALIAKTDEIILQSTECLNNMYESIRKIDAYNTHLRVWLDLQQSEIKRNIILSPLVLPLSTESK